MPGPGEGLVRPVIYQIREVTGGGVRYITGTSDDGAPTMTDVACPYREQNCTTFCAAFVKAKAIEGGKDILIGQCAAAGITIGVFGIIEPPKRGLEVVS